MSSGWIVQGRVIMALILREVHTLYGSSRLGYLWAVIQTMFGIGIFWGIREIAGARAPHGMLINGMKTSGKKRDNLGSIGKSFRRGCNSIAESATKKEGNQPSFFVGG